MKEQPALLCHQCRVPLETARTTFSYMGHTFHTDLPRCPQCGQVFISEELVRGKMADVEAELEDK